MPACPLPQLDFDVITLAHGSGGLLTRKLLDQCVFEVLGNEFLATADDGAVLTLDGSCVVTTDSFVVSPAFFPGGDIGDLAVHGTVNDVAMCGGIPQYISLGLILEEGLPIAELWQVLVSIRNAAHASGVKVVTGDTKVVDKGKGDKIFINTTGIGSVHPKAILGIDRIGPGDRVIVSGPVASHGMAIMAVREGISFDSPIVSDTAPVAGQVKVLLERFGEAVKFLRDPTRGGVATVLNEVVDQIDLGIELEQSNIPVLGPVQDLCEILGLDPLYVANEGIFLAVVDEACAEEAVQFLTHRTTAAEPRIIGTVCDAYNGQVVSRSALGSLRPVHMPVGEQLPRIC